MPNKTVINGGDGVFLRWSFGKLTVILQSLAKKASSLKGAFTVGTDLFSNYVRNIFFTCFLRDSKSHINFSHQILFSVKVFLNFDDDLNFVKEKVLIWDPT